MARTVAGLPEGSRITDYISIGVLSKTFPLEKVNEILEKTGRASQRERELPAHVVMYYEPLAKSDIGVDFLRVRRVRRSPLNSVE